ncbi:hypothetical protein BDP55DRAFT_122713 [Colletotrichum godetiae]|uniref:Uncharacterized protein n=1 Tax=Colletotrichum godetiae TaxID=1209918 RepID=A0AAJ0AXQ9_9PEZI|nr:uncharacterized protein BDP55DRAFT_122713 [Colletotrichum godetiae]KAK1700240.1 hypothetical protein BDP55DRAFT_122713 [Colletotrichum godetiae]
MVVRERKVPSGGMSKVARSPFLSFFPPAGFPPRLFLPLCLSLLLSVVSTHPKQPSHPPTYGSIATLCLIKAGQFHHQQHPGNHLADQAQRSTSINMGRRKWSPDGPSPGLQGQLTRPPPALDPMNSCLLQKVRGPLCSPAPAPLRLTRARILALETSPRRAPISPLRLFPLDSLQLRLCLPTPNLSQNSHQVSPLFLSSIDFRHPPLLDCGENYEQQTRRLAAGHGYWNVIPAPPARNILQSLQYLQILFLLQLRIYRYGVQHPDRLASELYTTPRLRLHFLSLKRKGPRS